MQERITAQNSHGMTTADVVVQYHADLGSVGIGLEPTSDVPNLHLVDAIYGGVPSQTRIGKIFWEEKSRTVGDTMFNAVSFETSDKEDEFYNNLGRAILDSVSGSSTFDAVWTWLDRAGVNRLIRLLRKGRDLAFGRDE